MAKKGRVPPAGARAGRPPPPGWPGRCPARATAGPAPSRRPTAGSRQTAEGHPPPAPGAGGPLRGRGSVRCCGSAAGAVRGPPPLRGRRTTAPWLAAGPFGDAGSCGPAGRGGRWSHLDFCAARYGCTCLRNTTSIHIDRALDLNSCAYRIPVCAGPEAPRNRAVARFRSRHVPSKCQTRVQNAGAFSGLSIRDRDSYGSDPHLPHDQRPLDCWHDRITSPKRATHVAAWVRVPRGRRRPFGGE